MTRCPDAYKPTQHRGKRRYRLAGRTMRCVLEEGHEVAHVYEPETFRPPMLDEIIGDRRVAYEAERSNAPRTTAESDALYREHLRKKARRNG